MNVLEFENEATLFWKKKHILIVNSLNYAKNHFAHVTDAVRSMLFRISRFLYNGKQLQVWYSMTKQNILMWWMKLIFPSFQFFLIWSNLPLFFFRKCMNYYTNIACFDKKTNKFSELGWRDILMKWFKL